MEASPQRVASRFKLARAVNLGFATESSGNYGSTLSLRLDPATQKVFFTLSKWSQIGGMDSLHGAGKADDTEKGSVDAVGREVALTLRSLLKADNWLSRYKISDFKWQLGNGKKLQGITVAKAQAAIDSWSMGRDEWEAKWEKPVVKPSGGPFSFSRGTTLRELSSQLDAAGFATTPTEAGTYGKSRKKLVLKNGRQWRALQKALEASADSLRKSTNQDGWDLLTYDFGGQKIVMVKSYLGYPVNGMAWTLSPE